MDDSTPKKVCTKCQLPKPLSEFHKEKTRSDGRRSDCKACNRARALKYRANNLEEAQAKDRERSKRRWIERREEMCLKKRLTYQRDKRQVLKQRARYYRENRDAVLIREKLYRKQNLLRKRFQEAKYRERFRELINARARARTRANPEIMKNKNRRRRARVKGASGTFTEEQFRLKLAQHKNYCHWCGKIIVGLAHPDHLIPLSKGGSNDIANIVPAHPACNFAKYNKMPWEFMGRLL